MENFYANKICFIILIMWGKEKMCWLIQVWSNGDVILKTDIKATQVECRESSWSNGIPLENLRIMRSSLGFLDTFLGVLR